MIRNITIVFVLLIAVLVSVLGFRGQTTRKEPLYLFPDMDRQNKALPQTQSSFFENGMNDRFPPVNTVVRGNGLNRAEVFSREYSGEDYRNVELLTGANVEGEFVAELPLEVTPELMALGQERYEIFCTACHGYVGNGNGAIKNFSGPMLAPADLLGELYVKQPDGEIYNTIVNGKNTMASYGDKLSVEERWAVVLYVRALQRAGNATLGDVPASERKELGL